MQNLSCREDSIAKLKYFLLINPSKQLLAISYVQLMITYFHCHFFGEPFILQVVLR